MRIEVFQVPEDYALKTEEGEPLDPGWYYWYVLPGCLPDSDAYGPFASEEEAQYEAECERAEWAADDAADRAYQEWKERDL